VEGKDDMTKPYFGGQGVWQPMNGKPLKLGQMSFYHLQSAINWVFMVILKRVPDQRTKGDNNHLNYLINKLNELFVEANTRNLYVPVGRPPPHPNQFKNGGIKKFFFSVRVMNVTTHFIYDNYKDVLTAWQVYRSNMDALRLTALSAIEEVFVEDNDDGQCPSCEQARPRHLGCNLFEPGSVCPHCGHVEPANEAPDNGPSSNPA
jgi:hypothetical protein